MRQMRPHSLCLRLLVCVSLEHGKNYFLFLCFLFSDSILISISGTIKIYINLTTPRKYPAKLGSTKKICFNPF
jgi:hypothetical protein